MAEMIDNKLVRDKIPQMIKENNKKRFFMLQVKLKLSRCYYIN
ncbi:hypothetical protein [Bacillus aquiflavi]|nr:hypothetical protein [Bacillus aquiflavi]